MAETSELISLNECESVEQVIIKTGEAVLLVNEDFSAQTHRIVSGVAVAYTTEQANQFASGSPIRGAIWNSASCTYVDTRSLQEIKDAKWLSIKLARETHIDAPLVTPYGTVDSKAKDRTNITDAVLLLQTLASVGTPTTIDFTLADNTTVTLTTTEMVTVGLLLGQKVQAAHATARSLRAAIDAALTSEALEEITWPT